MWVSFGAYDAELHLGLGKADSIASGASSFCARQRQSDQV